MEWMLQDFIFGLRQLRRNPGFAAAAILTLALGIGSNAAIYQVLDAVLFRSLPVHDPQGLVRVQLLADGRPQDMSFPSYRELAARQSVASGMFAVSNYPLHAAILRGRGTARTVNAALVSGQYFTTLGVSSQRGRPLSEADDQASAPPVAVISDRFWDREFGRSPSAVGQTLDINQAIVTIIGVTPAGFYGETQGNAPDVWLPMSVTPQVMATDWRNAPKASWLVAMARMKPGVTQAQARAAFDAIARQMDGTAKYGIDVQPGSRGIAELQVQFANPLYVLMAVVALVLLIACCNLANLLLARAASRSHEIGVRLAIGASRGRVMRQLICESLLLSAIGAGVALAFASWGSAALVKLASEGQTLEVSSVFHGRVLAFTTLITAIATCLFSISPAWSATRDWRPNRRSRPGRSLAVAEIAISCVLLAGSSMLVRSLWALRHQDFGFRSDNILLVDLPWEFNPAMMARYKALMQPLYDRLNQLSGVRSAALSGFGPMGGDQHTGAIASADRTEKVRIVHVSPRYFETMQTAIVQGRAITADDHDGAAEVAVLSQTAARIVFGGANPVGQLVTQGDKFDGRHAVRIVGVAHDVRFASPGEPFGSLIYVPMAQSPAPITTLSIRTSGEAASVASNVQATLHALDPNMAIGSIRPLSDALDAKLSHERLLASVATAFGLLALALTTVGVYGVIAYGIERRVREIGIRLALGATRHQVTRALMKDVGILVLAGSTAGLIGAIAATRALRSMLFAFGTSDYLLLAGAILFLILVAALAGYLPARRAAHLDPMTALRDA